MAILYTDSSSFNNMTVSGSTIMSASRGMVLQLRSSGSTIFSVSGSVGEIFNISDAGSSNNLFTVASGSIDILNIDNTKTVNISGSLVVTGSITGSLHGTASWAISASNAISTSVAISSSYALSASYALNSSNALTASYINTLNQDVIINGNVNLNGTASITYLNVTYESASVIYSSGSNQLGDAVNDTQTLIGNVNISGSLSVTGSTVLSGSLRIDIPSKATNYLLLSDSDGNVTWINPSTITSDKIVTGSVSASVSVNSANIFTLSSGSRTLIFSNNTGNLFVSSSISASGYSFNNSNSNIQSVGNAYINFYPRNFNGFTVYNNNSTAEGTRVGIGNIAGSGIESATYVGAMLIIESTTKGFLPPRMTGLQVEAIPSPANGLMVYCNNGNGVTVNSIGWWGYEGSWKKFTVV